MRKWVAAYCEMRWRKVPDEDRRELYALSAFREREFEVFCPFEREIRQQKIGGLGRGRTVSVAVDVPVYAPYAFVRTDEFLAALRVPGVASLVACLGKPLIVPDKVVERLRALSSEKGLVVRDITKPSFWFRGTVGQEFDFGVNSALKGLTGRIASVADLDETGTLTVWVNMFGAERGIAVPVEHVGQLRRKLAA